MTGTSDGKLVARKYEEPKPTLSITEDMLPEIKKWKVGKKYKLDLTVEMVSASKGDEYQIEGSKPKHKARFKVLEAQECDDENYKTKTN